MNHTRNATIQQDLHDRMDIRTATQDDISAIDEIYSHYVANSIATFEERHERSTDMIKLLESTQVAQLPFIVAVNESSGNVTGYAYARPYHVRSAYRFTVEDSIYLHPAHVGKGISKLLLRELIARLKASWRKRVIAAIAIMPGDEAGNLATCRLHRSFGFEEAGRVKGVGFKFERWIDVVYFQLSLDDVREA